MYLQHLFSPAEQEILFANPTKWITPNDYYSDHNGGYILIKNRRAEMDTFLFKGAKAWININKERKEINSGESKLHLRFCGKYVSDRTWEGLWNRLTINEKRLNTRI